MSVPRYWSPDGKPLTLEEWVEMFERCGRQVARDEVVLPDGERLLVSTVWIGIAMDHYGDLPLIFETMLFGAGGSDGWQIRTSTRDEALAAHEQALQYARRIVANGVASFDGGIESETSGKR